MINPYFCYIIAFLTALLVYPLNWSDLYPALSGELILFLAATIAVHAYAGYRFASQHKQVFTKITTPNPTTPAIWVTGFLYTLWCCEFFYEGGVPLIKILLGYPYDYRLFGIPTLHVLIVTFSSFYTIYLFNIYLSSGKKSILLIFLLNLSAAILIYSRAMFFFNLSACFFMMAARMNRIPRVAPFAIVGALIALLYLFGVMGTLRVSREARKEYDNTLFLKTGNATASFVRSSIPKEYFWTYIYVTSPLANLQTNIDSYPVAPITARKTVEMINNEIVMDFISKRTNSLLRTERESEARIAGPFNVSTVYSRCFSYLGWTGMFIMAVVILIIPFIYLKLIPRSSPFFLTGFVTLCTMFLFLAYDNTIRLTGLSFQMIYPLLLHFGCKWLPRFKKIFI